jgi:hypothetical protein
MAELDWRNFLLEFKLQKDILIQEGKGYAYIEIHIRQGGLRR